MANIVPFGKHKGKSVEALLDDREYLNWLLQQGWFQQRYGNLYQIVINNGVEPSETPEHNAMQIRFLDEAYRLQFACAAHGEQFFAFTNNSAVREGWEQARKTINKIQTDFIEDDRARYERDLAEYKERIAKLEIEIAQCDRCGDVEYPMHSIGWHGGAYEPSHLSITIPEIKCCGVPQSLYNASRTTNLIDMSLPTFEVNGVDVQYWIQTGFDFEPSSLEWEKCRTDGRYGKWTASNDLPAHCKKYSFIIEIKPSIGDDYPATLRQVQRSKSNYLLIRSYTGVGATQEQFVEFFKSQGVRVVFESDVDAITLPLFDIEMDASLTGPAEAQKFTW